MDRSSLRSCAETSQRELLANSKSTMPNISWLILRLGALDLHGAHTSVLSQQPCRKHQLSMLPRHRWSGSVRMGGRHSQSKKSVAQSMHSNIKVFAAVHQSAALTWNVRQPSLEKPPLGSVAAARSANMLKPQSGSTAQKQWLVSASWTPNVHKGCCTCTSAFLFVSLRISQ